MKIRLLAIFMVAMLIAIPTMVFASHESNATGKANLHPQNQSGIKGKIHFTDDGSTLTINMEPKWPEKVIDTYRSVKPIISHTKQRQCAAVEQATFFSPHPSQSVSFRTPNVLEPCPPTLYLWERWL